MDCRVGQLTRKNIFRESLAAHDLEKFAIVAVWRRFFRFAIYHCASSLGKRKAGFDAIKIGLEVLKAKL